MKIEIEVDDKIMEQALIDGWNLEYDEEINGATLPPVEDHLDDVYIEDIVRGLGSVDPDNITMTRVL